MKILIALTLLLLTQTALASDRQGSRDRNRDREETLLGQCECTGGDYSVKWVVTDLRSGQRSELYGISNMQYGGYGARESCERELRAQPLCQAPQEKRFAVGNACLNEWGGYGVTQVIIDQEKKTMKKDLVSGYTIYAGSNAFENCLKQIGW